MSCESLRICWIVPKFLLFFFFLLFLWCQLNDCWKSRKNDRHNNKKKLIWVCFFPWTKRKRISNLSSSFNKFCSSQKMKPHLLLSAHFFVILWFCCWNNIVWQHFHFSNNNNWFVFLTFEVEDYFSKFLFFESTYLSKPLFLELLFLLSVVFCYFHCFCDWSYFHFQEKYMKYYLWWSKWIGNSFWTCLTKSDWLISVFVLILCLIFFSMWDWLVQKKQKGKHWLKINKNCFPFLSNSLEVEHLCWFMLEN